MPSEVYELLKAFDYPNYFTAPGVVQNTFFMEIH